MKEKTLQRVTSGFMQDLYEEQEDNRQAANGVLLIRHIGERSSQVFGSGRPFQTAQLHIGIVVCGEQDVTVNLRHRHLSPLSVLVASPESIMQENGRTEDFDMQIIHVDDNALRAVYGNQIPPLFAHRMNDHLVSVDETQHKALLSMLDALWQIFHTDLSASQTNLLAAILNLIVSLSQRNEQSTESPQPRNVAVFNRFLSLVAEHCDRQRSLHFYADKLCLSKQYLGSIILEVSHRKASEWIEDATLARIKVMLLHGTAPLSEISESMSFPEPSHFSRYFKRLTGLTPNQYRRNEK